MKILLILGEQPNWQGARHLSYHCHLGLEESLRNVGVEVTTLMNPFLRDAASLLRGRKFDQVWAEVFVNPYLDDEVCRWMAEAAPVRLGLCAESTVYSDEEFMVKPELATMSVRFRKRLPFLTHLALGDEVDPPRLRSEKLKTAWWVVSANRELIQAPALPEVFQARFFGHVYGERKRWVEAEGVNAAPHAESKAFTYGFDAWQLLWRLYRRQALPPKPSVLNLYLAGCRRFRRGAAESWQRHLQSASAVISLPLIFKSFPGRITEAMAANRPVLCWKVPERPRMLEVFRDGEEILYYSNPEQLQECTERLRTEPQLSKRLAERAQQALWQRHTTEIRVKQLLNFVATGEEPDYSA